MIAMGLRLEDMIDMGQWKGLEYHWGMSNWDKSRTFRHNFPVAFFSTCTARLLTLPIDRLSFAFEVQSLNSKWNYKQILKESTFRKTLHPPVSFIAAWSLILPLNETLRTFMLIREDPGNHPVRSFLCGALASMPATAMTHPLDMACCACAIESSRKGHNMGLISNLESRYLQGGYQYLYAGLKANVIKNSTLAGVLFTSYATIKQKFGPSDPESENSIITRTALALPTAILSSILVLPLEVSRRDIVYQSCQRHPDNVESLGKVLKSCGGKVMQRAGYLLMQVPALAIALIIFEGYKKYSNQSGIQKEK